MSCVAIIPARGGSVRVPRKNIKPFHGKPIIAYSIEVAKKCWDEFKFDEVIVSTDDGEIADIAASYGASIFWREREIDWDATRLSIRKTNGLREVIMKPWPDDGSKGTQEVARDVLLKRQGYEYACVIYATAPLIDVNDIQEGAIAVRRMHFNYAFAVGANPLMDAGQFYWGDVNAIVQRVPLISQYSAMIAIDNERVCDINTEDDWKRAEQMYSALNA